MNVTGHKGFSISHSGWIVGIILSLLTYWLYYTGLYPELIRQVQPIEFKLNNVSTTSLTGDFIDGQQRTPMEGVYVRLSSPRFLANFDDGELLLEVQNNTQIEANGCLYVSGRLTGDNDTVKEILLPVAPTATIGIKLPPAETQTYPITIHINDPDAKQAEIALSYVPGMKFSTDDEKLCKFPDPGEDKDQNKADRLEDKYQNKIDPKEMIWADSEGSCVNKASKYACIPIDGAGGFAESVVRLLLLPPWANTVLPLVIFVIVGLSETLLENAEKKTAFKKVVKKGKFPIRWIFNIFWNVVRTFIAAILGLAILGSWGLLFWLPAWVVKKFTGKDGYLGIPENSLALSWESVFKILPVALTLTFLMYGAPYVVLINGFRISMIAQNTGIGTIAGITLTPLIILGLQDVVCIWTFLLLPKKDQKPTPDSNVLLFRELKLKNEIDEILGNVESNAYDSAYEGAKELSRKIRLPDHEGDFGKVSGLPAYVDEKNKEIQLNKGASILEVFHKKIIHYILNDNDAKKDIDKSVVDKLPYEMQDEYKRLAGEGKVIINEK